jgi:hypothetical protein
VCRRGHLLTSVTLSNQCQLSCSWERARLYSREGYSATLAVRDAAPLTVSLKLRPARTGPGERLSDGIPEDSASSLPRTGDARPSSMPDDLVAKCICFASSLGTQRPYIKRLQVNRVGCPSALVPYVFHLQQAAAADRTIRTRTIGSKKLCGRKIRPFRLECRALPKVIGPDLALHFSAEFRESESCASTKSMLVT